LTSARRGSPAAPRDGTDLDLGADMKPLLLSRVALATSLTVTSLGALATSCVTDDDDKPDESDVKGGVDGKAEAWGAADSPALFSASLEYRWDQLPRTGEAQNIPWAASYWPVYEDSINYKWDGANSTSASAKYGEAFGVTGVEDNVSKYHGIDGQSTRTSCTSDAQCNDALGEGCAIRPGAASGRCIPTWWGICHAWAPAAIITAEPKVPVTHNGVTFKVNDIKALTTLVHDRTENRFVSLRCDDLDSAQEISFDKYGRPTGGDANCRDTNPGTFHVLMTNYLGKQREAFVYDRTFDGEVWNQPLRGYRITRHDEVTAQKANELIGVTAEGGTTTEKTGTVTAQAWSVVGAFDVTPGQKVTVTMTGSGDPDLYARFGSAPTTGAYDCRPYDSGAAEACDLTVPAGASKLHVGVYGYAAATYAVKVVSGGQIPTTYAFNSNAAKLFYVHMDVDYISEASSETDGNLASKIDQYTHKDSYDYVLEVDAAGKVIGGEWTGNSKRKHPDFVWLPVRASGASVAGGKITYANVKMLLDKSQGVAPPPAGGDKTVTDAGRLAKAAWKQLGPFNVAAGASIKAVMTGTGDADLYVRKTAAPTAASYDCRPYKDGTAEECTVVGPGAFYVGVNGYAATSDYQLTITYKEGGGVIDPPPPPPAVTHLDVTSDVALQATKAFSLDVIAGKKIFIRTFAPNDVDLYVQMNAAPTTSSYLYRGYTSSGNETISFTPTSSGKLHIGVYGYKASSFTLRTADS
jgi:hypothetical protein